MYIYIYLYNYYFCIVQFPAEEKVRTIDELLRLVFYETWKFDAGRIRNDYQT